MPAPCAAFGRSAFYRSRLGRLTCVLVCLASAAAVNGWCGPARAADDSLQSRHAAEQFFERKIRPVFVEHCHKCHGGEKQKGGLKIDSLQGLLTGGDSGPAIVPGDAEHSLLIQAIKWGEDGVQMPPTKKLPDAVIADFVQWVQAGAAWPGADPAVASAAPKRSHKEVTQEDRQWWAFQPVHRPADPATKRTDWAAGSIDKFILTGLEAKQLAPNPRATPRELIRRATFDLLGLPPTPEEVARFERDPSPAAFAAVIDDLLARPQYGERWARHWLDVVRYAQTNGYERDGEKPHIWRYRDYVVRALNADKPYDRFLLEQLAGDELPDSNDDALIATGFYRLGVWDDEPDDSRMAEFDGLDDIMVATGAAFMGLTLGCCRCHDHRFDPIPQEDYYRMLAMFRGIRPYTNPQEVENSPVLVPLGDRKVAAARFAAVHEETKQLQESLKKTEDRAERRKLEQQIAKLEHDAARPLHWALAVRERAPADTHVLIRGNAGTPGDKVEPGFLSVLTSAQPEIVPPHDGQSSGRRLALARWLASAEHPLSARVMVNRVWQHHFGRGIVKTTSDFGRGGTAPTHPQLLDWLAAEFVADGWSLKRLHKTIMLSAAYQMASTCDNEASLAGDPANDLFWRQNLRRLEAEAIRDAVLAVSGDLNPEAGGRGFFPHLAGEVLAGGSRPGAGWEISPPQEQARRSIYAFIKRSMVPPLLEGFDYATTASPLAERSVTTVAPQALMLLNDQFLHDQAQALARRLEREAGPQHERQIERVYQLALGRKPSPRETHTALAFLARQAAEQGKLADRLTFVPDVPISLHSSYLNRLQPHEYLRGPQTGWSYYKGKWKGGYEGIMTVSENRGPFALWQGAPFADGVIEGCLWLQSAVEFATVIFRATAEGDVFRGYEVVFDPRNQTMALRRHGADVTLLGDVPVRLATGKPLPIKIEFQGPRIRVWCGEERPAIDLEDPQPLQDAGRLGVRSWGAATSFDALRVTSDKRTVDIATGPTAAAEHAPGVPPGWERFGGTWTMGDGGVLAVEPAPGAKAIWNEVNLGDGTVEADVMLREAKGDGGIVLRVTQPTAGVDALTAYNINFQPNGLRLGKHQNNWREISRAPVKFPPGQWRHLRVVLAGPHVRIYVDHAAEPAIDYTDENPLPPGSIGVRTFNAHLAVKNLAIKDNAGGKAHLADFQTMPSVAPAVSQAPSNAQHKALASLCLLIFNLNEFVYVD